MELPQNFTLFTHDGREWVWFDELVKLLKEDTSESTKPSKLERHFNGYRNKDRICLIQERKALPVISLIKYIFHKMETCVPCERLALNMEKCVIQAAHSHISRTHAKDGSIIDDDNGLLIFDLYKEIAASDIGGLIFEHEWTSINEQRIQQTPYLLEVHQSLFSPKNWRKIQIFELHFGLQWTDMNAPLEDINKAKWRFWRSYCKAKSLSAQLVADTKDVMKRRNNRKELAARNEQPVVRSARLHTPYNVQEDLKSKLKLCFDQVGSLLVVDTEELSKSNVLQICIELTTDSDIHAMSEMIWRVLSNEHQCGGRICFFSKGMLNGYRCQEKVATFTFRDALFCGKLQSRILHVI
jgi:hypothetical protein